MQQIPDPHLSPQHLQAALDASCAALHALESAREHTSVLSIDLGRAQANEAKAIELVRTVIDDLRSCEGASAGSPLAQGFAQGPGFPSA